jgi:hypothetical protein
MNQIRHFYDQFQPLDAEASRLDLGDPKFMDGLGQLAKTILKNKLISPEFLFLSRTESGLFNLLHILKARVATTEIARQWLPAM